MLVFVTRVGHALHVPAGYAHSNCTSCGAPVWVSPITLRLARVSRLRLVYSCDGCTEREFGDLL
jgi:hypothetical protein